MSENASESSTEGGNTSGETPAADEFKPITSQADLDRLVGDRVRREREKYADYRDVKAKAARLDQLEQANLTEVEKANARIAAAEERAAKAESVALRLRIAAKHGISDDDADLFLTGTDEESLTAQAKRLSDREADRKRQGNQVPREGNNPQSGKSDSVRDFTRDLFARATSQ